MVPGADRATCAATTSSTTSLIFFTYLYAPTVLGLEVDPGAQHPRADGARRAGDPARHLQGRVQPAGRDLLSHRERAAVRQDAVPRSRRCSRRSSASASTCPQQQPYPRMPARRRGRSRDDDRRRRPRRRRRRRAAARVSVASARRAARCSAAGIGCTVRSLLYGGRIDPGKGCEELIEYFSSYVKEGGDATLVLMGVKLMALPEEPFIRFAGLLSDRERLQALEAATVVVCPSPYESLSLLALEAMAVGTPVLVNARSAVLVEHCVAATAACTTPTATSSSSA